MTRGLENLSLIGSASAETKTALTSLHVGVAALCPGCKAKSAAAI